MKIFESGRSMIEMLGVLAIIGVLSVGGLSGYTMAMNRHRANQVLDYAQRAAVLFQTSADGEKAQSGAACTTYNNNEASPSGMTSGSCKIYSYSGRDQVTIKFQIQNASLQDSLISRSSPQACVNNGTTGTSGVETGEVAIDFNCVTCPCKQSGTPAP